MQKISSKQYSTSILPKSRNLIDKLKNILLFLFFFFVLFFPRQYSVLKGGLALLIILCNLNNLIKLKIKSRNTVPYIFYFIYCFIGIAMAISSGIVSFDLIKVRILWFGLFALIVATVDKYSIKTVILSCFISYCLITIYNLMLVGVAYNVIPNNALVGLDYTAAVGIHDGYVHITSTNTSMYMLLYPMFTTAFFVLNKNQCQTFYIKRSILAIFNLIATICILLTGRRILWLSMIFSLAFILFFVLRKKRYLKLGLFILVGLFVIFLYFGGYLDGLINRFLNAFSQDDIRYEQLATLSKYIKDKPLFGYGFEREFFLPSKGWINSIEVTYMQMLFNTGIVGCVCYFIFYIWMICKTAKLEVKDEYGEFLKAFSVSCLVFMLFANATNPYIGSSFDFYIFLFVPFLSLKIKSNPKKI